MVNQKKMRVFYLVQRILPGLHMFLVPRITLAFLCLVLISFIMMDIFGHIK